MEIVSLKQAQEEIVTRYNHLLYSIESYKPQLFERSIIGDVSSIIGSDKFNVEYVLKRTFTLGAGFTSNDTEVSLHHKCLYLLVLAKWGMVKEPLFYPNIINPLKAFDTIYQVLSDLKKINTGY